MGGLEGDEEGLEDVLDRLETSLDEVFTPCDAAARNEETRNHFWSTVKAKTINGKAQLHALVDGKKIIITESSVRRDFN
ncbi:hypothetical protein Tco_1286437 [Tanacetum coccineum]